MISFKQTKQKKTAQKTVTRFVSTPDTPIYVHKKKINRLFPNVYIFFTIYCFFSLLKKATIYISYNRLCYKNKQFPL